MLSWAAFVVLWSGRGCVISLGGGFVASLVLLLLVAGTKTACSGWLARHGSACERLAYWHCKAPEEGPTALSVLDAKTVADKCSLFASMAEQELEGKSKAERFDATYFCERELKALNEASRLFEFVLPDRE